MRKTDLEPTLEQVTSKKMAERKRAVTPDGGRIKELRQALGWQAEDLATRADLSLKTIRTAESGKGVDLASLGLIATALNVEVAGLIAKEQTPGEIEDAKEGGGVSVITLQKYILDIRQCVSPEDAIGKFTEKLAKFINILDEIHITVLRDSNETPP